MRGFVLLDESPLEVLKTNTSTTTTTNCAGRLFLPRVTTTTMVRNARGGGGGDLADAQRRRGEDQTRRKESERTYAISYTWNDPFFDTFCHIFDHEKREKERYKTHQTSLFVTHTLGKTARISSCLPSARKKLSSSRHSPGSAPSVPESTTRSRMAITHASNKPRACLFLSFFLVDDPTD